MTRTSFIADVHLGNHLRMGGPLACSMNGRCRLTLDVLGKAARASSNCTALVVLGDLFDTYRPEPPLIAEAQRRLDAAPCVLAIPGNHDKHSGEPGDHAMAPLHNKVEYFDDTHVSYFFNHVMVLVPYMEGNAREWVQREVDRAFERVNSSACAKALPRILGLHVGLIVPGTPSFLRDSHDAVPVELLHELAEKHSIDAVLMGNWHNRLIVHKPNTTTGRPTTYFQLGALVPTGFDNPGLNSYGTVAHVDIDKAGINVSYDEVAGPRFVQATDKNILASALESAYGAGHKVFVEWTVPADEADAAGAQLTTWKETGRVYDGEICKTNVFRGGTGDGSNERGGPPPDVAETIAKHVAAMPLPEVIDRAEVLALTNKYLHNSGVT